MPNVFAQFVDEEPEPNVFAQFVTEPEVGVSKDFLKNIPSPPISTTQGGTAGKGVGFGGDIGPNVFEHPLDAAKQISIPGATDIENAVLDPMLSGNGMTIEKDEPLLDLHPENVANGGNAITRPLRSIEKTGMGLANYMTSPRGIGEAAAAMTPAGILVKAKWIYDMATGAGQSAGNLSVLLQKKDKTPADWQALSDEAVNTAVMLAGSGHLTSETAAGLTGIRAPLTRGLESQPTRLAKDMAQQLDQAPMENSIPVALPANTPTFEQRKEASLPVSTMGDMWPDDAVTQVIKEASPLLPMAARETALSGVNVARSLQAPKPEKVTIPETPAEPDRDLSAIQEIQKNGATTKEQIQALFPSAGLSREAAAKLRDQAWQKVIIEKIQESPKVATEVPNVQPPQLEEKTPGVLNGEAELSQSVQPTSELSEPAIKGPLTVQPNSAEIAPIEPTGKPNLQVQPVTALGLPDNSKIVDTPEHVTNPSEDIYGVAARVRTARAQSGHTSPVDSGEGISREAAVEWGRELLRNGADPEKALSEFERTKAISFDLAAVTRAHGEQLAKAAKNIETKFGSNSDEYRMATNSASSWEARTKAIQTEWHKAGMAQQGGTDIDTGSFVDLQRSHKEATGKDFTQHQAKMAKTIADTSKATEQAAEIAKDKLFKALDAQSVKADFHPKVIEYAEKFVQRMETKSRQYLKELLGATWSPTPDVFAKMAFIGATKMARGFVEIGKWTDAMVSDLGERFRPHAEQVYAMAKDQFDKETSGLAEQIKIAVREKANPIPRTATTVDEVRNLVSDKNDGAAFTASQVKAIWQYAKGAYLDNGVDDFGRLVNGVATDLGMKVSEVRRALAQPKGAKELTDAMYGKIRSQRQTIESAKNWLKEQQRPGWKNFLGKVPRAFFNFKVFGHGTVGMITHAGNQMFQPAYAKAYWIAFIRQYPLAFGPKGIFHEKMMEDLQSHPLYNKAVRAGLVVDPRKFVDDYQQTPLFRWATGMGNRGFDALKLYRMDRFESEWNNLPDTLKTKEMAEFISDSINHSTGVVKASLPQGLSQPMATVMFAPKLELSRWAWGIGDPAKATVTFAGWRSATPEARRAALSEFKQKATLVGVYLGALVVNNAILSASNSNQRVNLADPKKPDWLSFKLGGHNLGIISPTISMVRFFSRELHALAGNRTPFEKLQGSRLDQAVETAGRYGRNKLSPFSGTVADVLDRHDWAGNTIPGSTEKPKFKGAHRMTVGEYTAKTVLPIPFEDALKEVWKGQGMNESQIATYTKALIAGAVVGGTGARLNEDTQTPKNRR